MGKKTEIHMGEPQLAGQERSLSAPVVSVGPRVDKGKRKAVLASGPTRQAEAARWRLEAEELRREQVRGYALAQEWEEELGRVRRKQDKAVHPRDLLLCEQDKFQERRGVQDDKVERLQVQLAQAVGLGEVAGPTVITAVEIDVLVQGLREMHEVEGWQCKWLLREVAGVRDNALTWAQEHCLLLNGLSLGVSYVMEEAASVNLPLELAQGVAQLGQLMVVHCHRNLLDPGSWLKGFVDRLQDSPSEEEIVEIVQEAMAAEFGPRGNGARGSMVGVRGSADGAQGPGGRAA
ncbi:hypothetical protein C0992_011518 [Termitomyces sp. T32_za158]|nr:hypothetical protein C0992_011518 [Termitomyces sp. T32_za158]